MKMVIISDTHFRKDFHVPAELNEQMTDADIIIHCGDFTSREFYDFLRSFKELRAVKGNNDRELSGILPDVLTFNEEGSAVTVFHGHLVSLQSAHYRYPDSDIIIHGHTHHPKIEKYDGRMILCPGSLTMNRYTEKNSFMTLELRAGNAPDAKIHYLTTGGI